MAVLKLNRRFMAMAKNAKMFLKTNILSLILAHFIGISATTSLQKMYTNKLDLTDGIQLFQDCYVHLIQAHFESLEAPKQPYDGSYHLTPLQFPVVLNRYNYKIHKYPDWSQWSAEDGIRPCTMLNANLSESSWLIFSKSFPQQKRRQQCKVILYVDSPLCDGLPLRESPPGFTFILHNELEFQKAIGDAGKSFRINEFMVYVGRRQHKVTSFWLEIWYSYETLQAKNYPAMIFFEIFKPRETNVLADTTILWTCPNFEAYHRLVKQQCSNQRNLKHLSLTHLLCHLPFLDYMYNEEILVPIRNVKSWQDFIDIRSSAPCESKVLLIVASNINDLPRRDSKVEYLLHWRDRVGTIVQIFLRTLFPNISYTNEAEYLFPDKYPNGLMHAHPLGLMYDQWQVRKIFFRPLLPTFTVYSQYTVVSETFFHSTHNDQIHFTMCSLISHSGSLSLFSFVSAFRWKVWVALILTVVVGGFVFQNANLKFTTHFEIAEGIFRILLTQGTKKLRTNKWFYGSWTMAGLVLTNAYLGDNIKKITAPLPILNWDTFAQILEHNLTIHSPILLSDFLRSTVPALNADFAAFQNDSYLYYLKTKGIPLILANFQSVFGTIYAINHYREKPENIKERLNQIESKISNFGQY